MYCEWQELTDDIQVHMCDGEPQMYKSGGDSWFPNQQPPARLRAQFHKAHTCACAPKQLEGAFGDANGVCPTHPKAHPIPLAKISRLQKALRGLSARVGDQAIYVNIDGLVGPHTIGATTRAMNKYAPGFTHAVLTRADVLRDAPQLAAWIERAPIQADASTPPPPPPAPMSAAQPGAAMPAYYPDDPGYAYGPPPPPVYYAPPPRRGPGGLPRHEASLDVKAFIPAQYDHIRVHPGSVMAVLGIGVIAYIVATRKKKEG